MKKHGIINSSIATTLSMMGHTDTITISDSGLPINQSVKRIDLAYKPSEPAFLSIVDVIKDDMVIEKITLAEEIKSENPTIYKALLQMFNNIPIEYVSHEEFKRLTTSSKAVVRTGEMTPFANIILHSGVNFGGNNNET